MTTLEERFETLIARIEDAAREVESGQLGDYDALNKEIMDVCIETQSAAPETAKALQGHMGKIILRLDELAAGITAYKNNIEKEKK